MHADIFLSHMEISIVIDYEHKAVLQRVSDFPALIARGQTQFNIRCLAIHSPALNSLRTMSQGDGCFQIEAKGILDEPQNVQHIALACCVGTHQDR